MGSGRPPSAIVGHALRRAVGGILALLAAVVPAGAFEAISDLTGRVTDPAGLPVAGAEISLLGTTSEALSGADGSFLLLRVAPGTYTLHVTADGRLPWSGSVHLPGHDVGGIEIALRAADTAVDAWTDAFSGVERYGSAAIQDTPVLLRAPEHPTGDAAAEAGPTDSDAAAAAGSSDGAAGGVSAGGASPGSALRLAALSNGRLRPESGHESYHLGAAEAGGRFGRGRLHYFVSLRGAAEEATPTAGPSLAASPFRFFPAWIRESESGRVRARLELLPGSWFRDDVAGARLGPIRSLTVDLEYSAATGQTFAGMWSRPGYVQAFLDTTQTGEIVLRHGRYSPTQLDDSYVWFDPQDHLPTEEESALQLRGVLAQEHRKRLHSVFFASLVRQTHTSRVADKEPWQYEGLRESDLWFNYTDREIGEYHVIANDFPRYAEGTRSELRTGIDVRVGSAVSPLRLGAEVGRVGLEYLEVLRPYQVNAEGALGNPRTDHYGAHSSVRAHLGKVWQVDSLRISAALGYEQFDLLAEWPAAEDAADPAREFLPRLELAYAITPDLSLAVLGGRAVRRPDAGYPETAPDALAGRYRVDAALVPESTTSMRAALLRSFGTRTRIEVALLREDTSEFLTTGLLVLPGQVGPVPTLTNGTAIESRAFEIRVERSFDDRLGATLRYRLGESREERRGAEATPSAFDVRHRFEASADLGLPGLVWVSARLRLASGAPFTPRTRDFNDVEEHHSRRLPSSATLDLDAEHRLRIFGRNLALYFETRNLLDARNLADLEPLDWPVRPRAFENEYRMYYTETGRLGGAYLSGIGPDENAGVWVPLGDPRVSGPPRRLRVGVAISF